MAPIIHPRGFALRKDALLFNTGTPGFYGNYDSGPESGTPVGEVAHV
jgi:hypothetical protein